MFGNQIKHDFRSCDKASRKNPYSRLKNAEFNVVEIL